MYLALRHVYRRLHRVWRHRLLQHRLATGMLCFALLLTLACGGGTEQSEQSKQSEQAEPSATEALKAALTFHASFDDGPNAAFALGDRRIYTAPSYKEQELATPGIGSPDIEIAEDAGRFGYGLRFKKKNTQAIFYRGEKNIPFTENDWSGSVSYWLSLSPDEDLEPGFCDPVQITDSAYNDSAVWCDFTKDDKPRHFRLGVFGDLKAWNPENNPAGEDPRFLNRLVVVNPTPFERGKWTHVVATYSALGTPAGTAKLYLNGELQGTSENISEAFTWDMEKAAFRIGVGYVGLFDEAALFGKALTAEEVKALYELEGGVASLHP